jgi:HAMP domain-containing protein
MAMQEWKEKPTINTVKDACMVTEMVIDNTPKEVTKAEFEETKAAIKSLADKVDSHYKPS